MGRREDVGYPRLRRVRGTFSPAEPAGTTALRYLPPWTAGLALVAVVGFRMETPLGGFYGLRSNLKSIGIGILTMTAILLFLYLGVLVVTGGIGRHS